MSKPQDGFVSRFLNRPISRLITRFLLKLPIHPDVWTLSIFILPVLACFFLLRGDYGSIVIGAALFQLHSILDGCDGEIARAKYLESERGRRLDALCDLAGSLLFTLCLGVGLCRQTGGFIGLLYFIEGILSSLLIAGRLRFYIVQLLGSDTTRPLVAEHDRMIEISGARFFGDRFTRFLFQITKRDVAIFIFLLLAIVGWPGVILHILFLFAVGSMVLAFAGRPKSRLRDNTT